LSQKAKSKTQQTRMEKTRKRKREGEDEDEDDDPRDGLAVMDHEELEAELRYTEARLEGIEDRRAELDGSDLLEKVKAAIKSETWYNKLEDLVLPGHGDETWNSGVERHLLKHICQDLLQTVLDYAKPTVKEACDGILEGMQVNSRRKKADNGFHIEISCFTGHDAVSFDADYEYDENDDGTTCSISTADTTGDLDPIASSLRVSGVVPLVVLASILFRPIFYYVSHETMLLDKAYVSDALDRFLDGSKEYQGVTWDHEDNRWVTTEEYASVDRDTFDRCCAL
jgi:hypothetical protein